MKRKLLFYHRLLVVVGVACCLLLLILTRLVDIQIINGSVFAQQADDNRYFTVRMPAQRGIFLDRYNQPLVWNKRTYAQRITADAIHTTYRAIDSHEALSLLATDSASVQFGLEREYRYSSALSHVLGYVGAVTAEDLLNDQTLVVSDLVGKAGLEKNYDMQLRGQAGEEVYEINAMGQRQRLVEKKEGKSGQAIATSLDPYLSEVAWQALGDTTGVVVIQDANTGEVLSLVSKPGYDANVLSTSYIDPLLEHQRKEQLKQLFTDPQKPFFNRATGGTYPPGSVFKLVTATGGLETEAINASTTVNDEGILKVGEYEYANWYFTQFGRTEGDIAVRRALARSNDIFFYKAAEWLGPVRLAEYARLFGYGSPTNIELLGEAAGTVPDPAWKERVLGEPWFLGNTFHMGIGQGDVLVTPLQVAQMTQALAHHGALCRPTLLKTQTNATCRELGLHDDYTTVVLEGMLDACSAGGTAFPFFPYNERHKTSEAGLTPSEVIQRGAIACKTGTAEFGAADERGYRKTHAWFTSIMGTSPIRDLAKRVAEGDQAAKDEITANLGAEAEPYLEWLTAMYEHGFPERLVMTALVESDGAIPYKEGSQHAAPVIKLIVDRMNASAPTVTVPVTTQ